MVNRLQKLEYDKLRHAAGRGTKPGFEVRLHQGQGCGLERPHHGCWTCDLPNRRSKVGWVGG
eukprot:12429489-Karenia_brevis.AAC.1